jgi:exosortase O
MAVTAIIQGILFLKKHKVQPSAHSSIQGIALVSISLLLHLYNQTHFQINVVSGTLLISGILGFLLCYFPASAVQRTIIPMITLVSLLPYADQLNDLVSFPLRIWTANGIAGFFQSAGITIVNQCTVLKAENATTHIATACSGIKGVWAIIICYNLISWIGNKQFTLKWIAGAAFSIVIIILFNIFRILLLVIMSLFHLNLLGTIIHESFGIFLFVVTVFITLYLLYITRLFLSYRGTPDIITDKKSSLTISILFPALLFSLACIITPRTPVSKSIPVIHLSEHKSYAFKSIGFTDIERSSLTLFPIDAWCKCTFKANNLSGSLAMIQSPNWKAHHNPLRCLKGSGADFKEPEVLQVNQNFSLNQINLENKNQFACFWFQNHLSGTHDYSQRLWDWVTGKQSTWTMISIVFDQTIDTQSETFIEFVTWLYSEVNRQQKERT